MSSSTNSPRRPPSRSRALSQPLTPSLSVLMTTPSPTIKKNAFFFFLIKRHEDLVAEGRPLPRGLSQVNEIISGEWARLSSEEKKVFVQRAEDHNAAEKARKGGERGATPIPVDKVKVNVDKVNLRSEPELKDTSLTTPSSQQPLPMPKRVLNFAEIAAEVESKYTDRTEYKRRSAVIQALTPVEKRLESLNLPLLILNFSTYNDWPLGDLLPAEVGLSVFTIASGIVQNFATLIDPGDDLPSGSIEAVTASGVKLGLPFPNYNPRARDYGLIIDRIFKIGRMYAHPYYRGLPTFHSLQKDLQKTELCLRWLLDKRGIYPSVPHRLSGSSRSPYQFQLLPLENLIHFLSQKRFKADIHYPGRDQLIAEAFQGMDDLTLTFVSPPGHDPTMTPMTPHTRAAIQAMKHATDPYRIRLPDFLDSPLSSQGFFVHPWKVAELLDTSDYAYHSELGCGYHAMREDGISFCPLNIANRAAYILLEMLTLSHGVAPVPGSHYPTLSTPQRSEELARRDKALEKWAIFDMASLGQDEAFRDPELAEFRRRDLLFGDFYEDFKNRKENSRDDDEDEEIWDEWDA